MRPVWWADRPNSDDHQVEEWLVPLLLLKPDKRGSAMTNRYRANLPWMPLAWGDQAPQYHRVKPDRPGIVYFRGQDPGMEHHVDCLLMFDENLELVGILNMFNFDFPPLEKKGNVTMFTRPDRLRRGIGSALMDEARRRWTVDFDRQDFTRTGAAFINRYVQQRSLADGISRTTGTTAR
jgi:GNAT superfamily N-acetyltransferase